MDAEHFPPDPKHEVAVDVGHSEGSVLQRHQLPRHGKIDGVPHAELGAHHGHRCRRRWIAGTGHHFF